TEDRFGVGYFFFRRFAGFFALAFAFLFFAIAALLSLSGWRYRCSAVANRSALHPDYYTGKKITVTPLNFVYRRRRPRRRARRAMQVGSVERGNTFTAASAADNFTRAAEMPIK
ncbi:MAG: hypothetical protein WAM75_08305, partial [Xanthobacteraceae bacterium]